MSLLESAIRLAVFAHSGQLDKVGKPFILHPLQVMFAAAEEYERNPVPGYSLEEFMAAAVLHDVAEDTKVTLNEILRLFGVSVHRIVDGVTRREGEVYMDFIVRAASEIGSRRLKRIDVKINLGRIAQLPVPEQSIRRRYERALSFLDADVSALGING
jgi:hypothetical protein